MHWRLYFYKSNLESNIQNQKASTILNICMHTENDVNAYLLPLKWYTETF